MTTKQGLKLSAIIDKLEIKIDNPKDDLEKVGADMMVQIVSKAHKAEKEIYEFIAATKGIDVKAAEEVDLVEFIKELVADSGIMAFFKSAVRSSGRG